MVLEHAHVHPREDLDKHTDAGGIIERCRVPLHLAPQLTREQRVSRCKHRSVIAPEPVGNSSAGARHAGGTLSVQAAVAIKLGCISQGPGGSRRVRPSVESPSCLASS